MSLIYNVRFIGGGSERRMADLDMIIILVVLILSLNIIGKFYDHDARRSIRTIMEAAH